MFKSHESRYMKRLELPGDRGNYYMDWGYVYFKGSATVNRVILYDNNSHDWICPPSEKTRDRENETVRFTWKI